MDDMGHIMEKLDRLHVRSIGYSLGLCDAFRHASWVDGNEWAQLIKTPSDTDWPGL